MSDESKFLFWVGTIPIILSIICAFSFFFLVNFLPKKLPLLYSLPWGESQLISFPQLLIIPALIIIISLINLLIFWRLGPTQFLFKRILSLISLVFSLILFVSLIKIILIFV